MRIFVFVLLLLGNLNLVGQIDTEYLKVGETAPSIEATDQNGMPIDSREILKDQKILLIFYRGNWCPHCKKHLSQLEGHLNEFKAKGVFVMVVSPESSERTLETSEKFNLSYSVVHDLNNKIMKDYKVTYEANAQTVPNYYDKIKQRINKYNVANNNVLPVPATYLIDEHGKIMYVHYDPNYKNRSDLSEVLKELMRE